MNSYALVRTEHLNHYGYLFGGQMLKWVDEMAWLAASRDFTGINLVTRAMNEVEFKNRVVNGSILRFKIEYEKQGNTSVTYRVDVYADAPGAKREEHVFTNHLTFVALDENGKTCILPQGVTLRSAEPQ